MLRFNRISSSCYYCPSLPLRCSAPASRAGGWPSVAQGQARTFVSAAVGPGAGPAHPRR